MFLVPSLDDIRTAILRDVKSLEPQADISPDSDYFARASALAAVAEGLYAHQKWAIKQFFPDTADTEFLEKHAALRGIKRKNATPAAGVGALLSGREGTPIPVGLTLKTEDGRFYEVAEATVIGSRGTAETYVRSLGVGKSQNVYNETRNIKATLMAAPAGVNSEAEINSVVGGTDAESDDALLERLLERIRRPPAGGNRYDYRRWALEVDGVDAAYVYPLRRGLGTVDIAITSNNDVPNDETVQRCQAYIDDVRPVTAKESKVVKPDVTRVVFNIQVKLHGVSLSTIKTDIERALREYFNTLIPGDDLIVSQCEAVVNNLIGVVDRKFTTPTTNRKANITTKIEWFRLGTVTVTELR